ncbi:hypothetical protein D3C78_1895770 [compost metagenome]
MQANFAVERLQQQHAPRHLARVGLLAAKPGNLGALLVQARLPGLVAVITHTTGTAQQFGRVVIGQAFSYPVTAIAIIDLGK